MKQFNKMELLKSAIYPIFWDNGSYSFINLTIKLKNTATIEILKTKKEDAHCFVTLIHEYVHFIQNFTTTFGFTNFGTYVDIFSVFIGENISLGKNPSIPTKNGIADIKLGNKNYANYLKSAFLGIEKDGRGKFVFQSTTQNDFTIIESSIINPYWNKDVYISYIAYKGKLIPLNEIVTSENMALIASYLSSGLKPDEIKQTINKEWEAQYHIIYSFLTNVFPDKDCIKLTYIISEISLLLLPHNKIISKILKYLTSHKRKFEKFSEDEIIHKIKFMLNFDENLSNILSKASILIDDKIAIFTKHEKEFEFFNHLKDILFLFKNGFAERAKSPLTYRDKFDSSFLNYYSQIIKSPILVFSDEKKTMLGDPGEIFINSIATVSGVLTVFHQTYFNNISKCPFATKNSLCSHTKGNECKSDPFSIYTKYEYEGCLFYNSLNILGLKKPGRS